MFNFRPSLSLLFLLASSPAVLGHPDRETAGEEQRALARSVLNLVLFTQWPAETFASEEAPLRVGIWSETCTNEELEKLASDMQLNDRPVIIERLASLDEALNCHVVLFADSEIDNLQNLLRRLRRNSVLTVSDTRLFAETGGMVQLSLEDESLNLKVNENALKRAGLSLSSKVLRLAELVEPDTSAASMGE